MVGHGICSVVMNSRICIIDAIISKNDDVVLTICRIENCIVVNIMVVAFYHQPTSSIPNHIVMHGSVHSFTNLIDWCVKSSTILDYIVNPIIGYFSTRSLTLHYLYNCTISLQITNIPHFIIEYFRSISN